MEKVLVNLSVLRVLVVFFVQLKVI